MNGLVRVHTTTFLLALGLITETSPCRGGDLWGASLGATSDYVVRGISRTDNQAALQLDVHYADPSGWVGGLFLSNAQLDPGEARDVEVDAFVGFAWRLTDVVRSKILASHYAYPWNAAGARYNYDELAGDVAYQEWLNLTLTFSPNAPRYFRNSGPESAAAESIEVSLQHRVVSRLSATAGVGYYVMNVARSAGYAYWSVGATYDVAPVSLTLSYVKTTPEANALFYNAANRGSWTGTVIWRFW